MMKINTPEFAKKILIVIMIIIPVICLFNIYGGRGTEDFYDTLMDTIFVGALFEVLIIFPFIKVGVNKRLKGSGIVVETAVKDVITVEDDHKKLQYFIKLSGPDPITGHPMSFESDLLNADPKKYLPQKINVYLDPNNFNKYYIDLEFLDEINPEEENDFGQPL